MLWVVWVWVVMGGGVGGTHTHLHPWSSAPGGVCPTGVPDWTATDLRIARQRPPARVLRTGNFLAVVLVVVLVSRPPQRRPAPLPYPSNATA